MPHGEEIVPLPNKFASSYGNVSFGPSVRRPTVLSSHELHFGEAHRICGKNLLRVYYDDMLYDRRNGTVSTSYLVVSQF